MQVHSQVLHDLQLQISSYLPTAMLQNDLRAHYTNKEKPWFLITQHAKADRICQLQSSLQSPQLHSRASRQPQTPCCQSHPSFDVPDLQLLKDPFILLTGCCAMLYSLHSTHLMVISIDVQWSTSGSHSRSPKSYCPYSEGHIQALPPSGGDSRISVQGISFTAFLVQVRKLAAHCSKVGKVAALFSVFSAVTGKLNWVCRKYRRGKLKSCFI